MIHSLATILDKQGTDAGPEVTVRCQVQSEPMPGEGTDELTVYLVDDPHNDIDEKAFLSFWAGDPPHSDLERTAPYVLSTLAVSTGSDARHDDGVTLQRGEELLVRAIPNRRGGDDAF